MKKTLDVNSVVIVTGASAGMGKATAAAPGPNRRQGGHAVPE